MNLTSFNFLLLVVISLIFYYILPKKISYIVLIISSLFFVFYNNFELTSIVSIGFIFLVSFIGGLLIKKSENDKKKKLICVTCVIALLCTLGYLKYTNFFISIINNLFNTNYGYLNINFPIGISYFSLIMIGYIVDTYWGVSEYEKNPFKLYLFMQYFPILTSGPFIKYSETKDNLYNKNKFNIDNILNGCLRSLWGFFKVLVISNRLDVIVDYIYNNLNSMNGLVVVLAILLYTIQLYTNFSGSIDIIIGVSRMFGINLPENFNNPFISETITEFWRRWHITLGLWLKNYIFYPLLKSDRIQKLNKICKDKFGKKGKKIPTFLCMFVLWFAIGFWHGGDIKYIISSGMLPFIIIVIEDIFDSVNKKTKGFIKYLRIIRTFILFSLCLVFFRATSVSNAIDIYSSIFNTNNIGNITAIGLSVFDIVLLALSIIVLIGYDNLKDKINNFIKSKSGEFRLVIILIFVLVILTFGVYGIGFDASEFIYGKF